MVGHEVPSCGARKADYYFLSLDADFDKLKACLHVEINSDALILF